ncbi:hypothetical protein FRC10_004899 [Ceratobasidium sp. 414]|nr:hypothetical protein FRC10_004899 [Ceratobasidium sp. 414]
MPPLGWRKAVDGAKLKPKGKQPARSHSPLYPPLVPERTGAALQALGGASFSTQQSSSDQGSRLSSVRREDANPTMEVDDPSADSTPAPGSAIPQGSSSEHTSNAGMTPPIRPIVHPLNDQLLHEEEEEAGERGAGGEEGGVAALGKSSYPPDHVFSVVEMSPSPSSEEESPPEEPAPLESEDEASEVASEPDSFPHVTLNTIDDELEDDEQDPDGEAEIDPDATGNMDEDLDELDAPEEIDEDTLFTVNRSKLTARQAALVTGGSAMNHVMLPEAPSRKAQRTEAEIALRRSETARKRKHQDAQRLEDEKTETINRLLKKQSVKARNKKALETPVGEPTADDVANLVVDNRPVVPCYRWVSSSKDAPTALTFSLPDTANDPLFVAENHVQVAPSQSTIRPPAICAVTGCTAQRTYRLPGAPDFETGACGMDHLKLLKTQVA